MPLAGIEDVLSAAGYAQVIVALKPEATPPVTTGAAPLIRAEAATALQNHFTIPSEAQAHSLVAVARRSAGRRVRGPIQPQAMRVYPHLGLVFGFVERAGAQALEASPQVERIDLAPALSLIRPVDIRPARAAGAGTVTWGIRRLSAERLWAAGYTGRGVVVGHLDTGVDGSHPALRGAIAAFAEFDLAANPVPGARARDSAEHGTHTAGTIAGRATRRGSFGMAPEAQLASALVIEGGDVVGRVLAGMDWIVSQRVRILSMSLGLRGYTPAFQVVVDRLRERGILPIFAVGNEGPNTSRSPGNYANVLSIGAIDDRNQVADFSSSQRFQRDANPLVPDLAAPGAGVLSCVPDNGYEEMDGTSMATPHIAGLAALLLQARPDASADQLEHAIIGSCVRPAAMPEARANHGVPDAVRAFALLTGAELPPERVAALARIVAKGKRARSRLPAAAARPKRGAGAKRKRPLSAPKRRTVKASPRNAGRTSRTGRRRTR